MATPAQHLDARRLEAGEAARRPLRELANHAADPASVTPNKLDAAVLCARCHQANTAKPAAFPQVVAEEHSAGVACDTCHQPHSPVIVAEGKK